MINIYILIIASLIYLGCLIVTPYKFHKIILISLLLILILPYILAENQNIMPLITISSIAGLIIIEALKNIFIKFYLKSKDLKKEDEIAKFMASIQDFSFYKIYVNHKSDKEKKERSQKEKHINSQAKTKEVKNSISEELAERRRRKQERNKQK